MHNHSTKKARRTDATQKQTWQNPTSYTGVLEREARPNRYVADSMLLITFVMLIISVLVETGLYNAIDKPVMRICTLGTLVFSVLSLFLSRYKPLAKDPRTKYVILTNVLVTLGMVSSLLNIHVVLLLILPMLLATQYYNRDFMEVASLGALICCIVSPLLAYRFDTWSFQYLSGYVKATCHVSVTATPITPDVGNDILSILLFMVLPQLAILTAFSVIFLAIAHNGERVFRQQEEIRLLNTMDSLTGLYNRDYFYHIAREFMNAHPKKPLSLIVTNIEKFKLYNDLFGYEEGNVLLKETAENLRRFAGEQGICARLADDHMAVLIFDEAFHDERWQKEVLQATASKVPANYKLLLRAGFYRIKDRHIPVSSICDRALMACYNVPANGKQPLTRYHHQMRSALLEEERMTHAVEQALRENRLQLFLQPQIRANGALAGAEALVRWHTDDGEVILPEHFISLCERNGLITDVDRQMWVLSCALLQRWRKSGHGNLTVSVNVSPVDFYRIDVYGELMALVRRYDVSPERLHIEITETAAMVDFEKNNELLRRLQSAGFHVEMDDFGSGYSSLGALKDLYVDTLKLDLKFLQETGNILRAKQIVRSIVEMARSMQMELIVEGVETQTQLEFLQPLHVDLYQGYLFSPPISVEEFEQKYF